MGNCYHQTKLSSLSPEKVINYLYIFYYIDIDYVIIDEDSLSELLKVEKSCCSIIDGKNVLIYKAIDTKIDTANLEKPTVCLT